MAVVGGLLAFGDRDDDGRETIAHAFGRDAADVERLWRTHLDRVTGREPDERLW
ncbi:MAG: hypothetical protein KY433_08685 [Actinobacteria bacterium]|nr:hypothetical protein [Actinomycetota bacterium]